MEHAGKRITLLVADDEAPIRMVVAEKFRSAGYEVVEARDGEEALELAQRHQPSGVITDLQMPYMNGLEFATRFRATAQGVSTPVLLLTARGHILTPDQLAQTNIRKVMSKPFGVRDLLAYVQDSLLAAPPDTLGKVGDAGSRSVAA
jgi:CheY-like chemotaxis protein